MRPPVAGPRRVGDPELTVLPRRAFRRSLAAIDRGATVAFVADLWSERGWETVVEDDTVYARREGVGSEERVIVVPMHRRWFGPRLATPNEADTVDLVVARTRSPAVVRFADERDARLVGPDDVYEMLLYSIERGAADDLVRKHFDRPLVGGRAGWRDRIGGRTSALIVVSLVVVLFVVLAALASGPLSSIGSPPGGEQTAPSSDSSDGLGLTATEAESDRPDRTTDVGSPRQVEELPLADRGVDAAWPNPGFDAANTRARPGPGDSRRRPTRMVVERLDSAVVSTPVVADGTVYVSTRNGSLYALDAQDLQVRWVRSVAAAAATSPTAAGDTVFVGGFSTAPRSGDPRDARGLYALEVTTGATRWSDRTFDVMYSAPNVADGTIYAVGGDRVRAIDADTGRRQWTTPIDGPIVSTPAVANGSVYVGSLNGGVYALDVDDGRVRWRFEAGVAVPSTPSVSAGRVYIGDADGRVHALDADSGRAYWSASGVSDVSLSIGSPGKGVVTSPAVAHATVYAGTENGRVHAFDVDDGWIRWEHRGIDGHAVTAPAVVGGTVYVGGGDGRLYALDAATGGERWSVSVAGSPSAPAVAGGVVYIGTEDGMVYAID